MRKAQTWRILFAVVLILGAYLVRRPWLQRDIWNLDEGSTFTMAEQVLHGGVIYRDAADNRSPLVPYLKAAVFAVCGDWNAHAVHVTVALLLGVAAMLLWLMARRLGDEKTGVGGALFFSVLTFVLLGLPDTLSAHTGWFVVFFSTVGFWLFARAQERPGFGAGVLVGLSFGLGTLCKQPGVLDLGVTVVLLGLLWLGEPARRGARWRLLAGELTGFAATMAATVLYFAWHHALADLKLYAWTYNTKYYVPEVPFWDRMWTVRVPFELAYWNMPAALVAGVIGAVLLLRHVWRELFRRPVGVPLLAWLILGWTASGLVSTMISGRNFSHYSAQVIPGLSLACGWTVARLIEAAGRLRPTRRWAWAGAWALLAVVAVEGGFDIRRRGSRLSPEDDISKQVGRMIQQFTAPTDHIFVWGYFPELYFFSQRLPSTRFIYTNYLTGMIPWTNLDMNIDTSYAIMPGAWQHLFADLDRRPPALIVDTQTGRGYLKYPLQAQTKLWHLVTRDFAAVGEQVVPKIGSRFYHRLAPLTAAPLPAGTPTSDQVTVTASAMPHGDREPLLTVHAPTGASEIVIYQADRPYRRLLYPAAQACDATFFIAREDLQSGPTVFRAAVREPGGWEASRPIDLSYFRQPPPRPKPTGPILRFGGKDLLPVAGETVDGDGGYAERNGQRWEAHAPSTFVYECPNDLTRLVFSYGLEEASYQQPGEAGTTGVDVEISFEHPGGGTTQLFWRSLNPRAIGHDRGTQTSVIDIPPHQGGRLIFRFLPGPQNDPAYDWSYWSNLGGQGFGPELRYGEQFIHALSGERFGGKPLMPHGDDLWSADSPAKVVYPFVPGMTALIFSYGLEDRSYEQPGGQGTDGIDVIVEFEHPDNRVERLFFRNLDPRNRPGDRGRQASRVALPANATGGHIIIRIGPGPHDNTAFDWAYLTSLRAQGPGPDITWGSHVLVPLESRTFNGPGMVADDSGWWRAHAPSRVVYQRPPDMTAVSIGFGLDPNSYANPNPGDRTDGVEAVVKFEHADGSETTLFQRRLTPATNPDDRGTQNARVELPPNEPGRLLFLFTPGPRNNNAYDWSYWTNFTGAP